jgi:serine/threonine-protein kinase HipA
MVKTAFVNIWGVIVGAVAWDEEQELGFFEYDSAFIKHEWGLSPLKMPINSRQRVFSFPENRPTRNSEFNTFKGLPGLLADVLPDKYGNQLINVYLAQQGRPENSMNPVEQLCFIGTRGMGALEFEPTTLKPKANTSRLEIDNLVEVAQKMLYNREAFQADLKKDEEQAVKQLISIGTSAGGARPKAIIAYNDKTKEVRFGQTKVPKDFEHWLIKLDGVSDVQLGDSHGYGRVEMAYYLMAKEAGINMMPCKLLEENGRAHFMTKRFDRDNNTKHHVQTFCAIKHFDFNEVNSFSYEQLFQTMRELRLPYTDAEELFKRMVFNVLARNCDDHTKNFAFLLKQGGDWQLAPAYDICHAYRPDSQWVSQHALSINGKRKDIDVNDFLTVAKAMNIKNFQKIMGQIDQAVSKWELFADTTQVDVSKKETIKNTLIHIKDIS